MKQDNSNILKRFDSKLNCNYNHDDVLQKLSVEKTDFIDNDIFRVQLSDLSWVCDYKLQLVEFKCLNEFHNYS